MQESIRQHATTLFLGKLAKASLGLFLGGISAGILAYIFQILMGRMLSPIDYGIFSAIMALVVIAEYFLIVQGRVLFVYLFSIFAPLQIGAIYLYHDSLKVVVAVMGVCGVLVAFVGYGLLWRDSRARRA
jgi:O-antigen/teichoic acid export membrane protein